MLERVFLGWDEPFLDRLSDWLLERKDTLPRLLVIVPTTQSGRRLREALAEKAGALLSPKIRTPGSLLKTTDPEIAADWQERLAWIEVLEHIEDWSPYTDLFPEKPGEGSDWAPALARELTRLRHTLQENGLTLAAASNLLSSSIEAGRWDALSRLEWLVEKKLQSWGWKSRSRVLAAGIQLPAELSGVVLAGITEMPPLVERALKDWAGPVTVLIGAPEQEADSFSETGKPLPCWTERTLPWPEGSTGAVHLVSDPRQQASAALEAVATRKTPSSDVALGSADVATGDELARLFTRHGWQAFHPATSPAVTGLARWFKVWSRWMADPKLAVMADLLALPQTSALFAGGRARKAETLSRLRDAWMVIRTDDLRRRMATASFPTDAQREAAEDTLNAAESLEKWRASLLGGDFLRSIERLLTALAKTGADTAEEASAIFEWFTHAAPMMRQVPRSPGFWLDLMISELPAPVPQPPNERVIDILGWLELFFEPGHHLVLCGMNEGSVPAIVGGDAWLGEAAIQRLGLLGNADRAARDAFLYQAILEARKASGRVDLICAKTGPGGDTLLPSRLLLAAERADLPARVKFLFRSIEPPDAGLRWQADWKWQPPLVEPPARLAVTSLAAWLACPFRYYLKFGLGMQSPEPDRIEWNARDFGTVAHEVLERWARDPEAREFSKSEAIHEWLTVELDRIAAQWFGNKLPLAIRLQTEVLRQRFVWFSHAQAISRAEGWQIQEVETKIELKIGGSTIVAKVDRIDRHRETGELRVIDYKTGKVESVERAHRRRIRANTVLPEHLSLDCPAVCQSVEKGKTVDYRWVNLQLPLYTAAIAERFGAIPTPCYFTLGSTQADVALREWAGYSEEDLSAAKSCAEWIVSQIHSGVFWPPAEKVEYDDFAGLAAGRSLAEMFAQPGT